MSNPLVSVIIPCFNGASYVAAAIESALNQSYRDREVIVVDDGSTDRSLMIIQGFGDRVRWVTGPNCGGSFARNTGLDLAKGDLIQFLDADDVLHPDKLASQVPLLSDPVVDLVYSDWFQCAFEDPDRKLRCRVVPTSEDPVLLALDPQNIQTDSPLFKKLTLVRVGGFRPGLPCCQERELILRLACVGARFKYLPGALHTVRLHALGISADERRVGRWMKTILTERYEQLKTRDDLSPARKWAFGRLMMRQARAQFRLDNRDLARECVLAAYEMDPVGARRAYRLPGFLAYRVLGPERAESLHVIWRRLVFFSRRVAVRLRSATSR
ncbi:MAG: glycosyltransferase [Casimicrobiaceae bacterium]